MQCFSQAKELFSLVILHKGLPFVERLIH